MSTNLRFTLGTGRNMSCQEVVRVTRVAEDNGFSHVTLIDQPNLDRDVHVMMTAAALNTRHIRVGHGVTDPFTVRPWVIANAAATIDELSGGRAFIGLGASGTWGGKMLKPRPLEELREAVQFIRKYMSGEEAEFGGARMHSEWVRRRVPIYMASAGPRSLQLAGEVADGVMVTGVNTEKVKWHLELIERGARRAGRDLSAIDIWCRTLCYIAESKEAARREVASYAATNAYDYYVSIFSRDTPEVRDLCERLERVEPGIIEDFRRVYEAFDPYQNEVPDAPHARAVSQRVIDFLLLTGSADEICDRIRELVQLGVKAVSVVDYTVSDREGLIRELGKRILPKVRG